jgi:hypothetical protein
VDVSTLPAARPPVPLGVLKNKPNAQRAAIGAPSRGDRGLLDSEISSSTGFDKNISKKSAEKLFDARGDRNIQVQTGEGILEFSFFFEIFGAG